MIQYVVCIIDKYELEQCPNGSVATWQHQTPAFVKHDCTVRCHYEGPKWHQTKMIRPPENVGKENRKRSHFWAIVSLFRVRIAWASLQNSTYLQNRTQQNAELKNQTPGRAAAVYSRTYQMGRGHGSRGRGRRSTARRAPV